MTINVQNHLNFRGDARLALDFYQSVFGGEVTAFSYEDAHNVGDPSEASQIMWGQVVADNGFAVMAYDVPSAMPWSQGENSFFVSVRGESESEVRSYWEGLSSGATIIQELAPAAWAPLYGMLKDKFGVVWVLDVVTEYVAG